MHDPDHVEGEVQRASDRVLTIPNALSAARLVGVPFFLWLVLNEYDAAAVIVLMVSGFTDWLDGKIARRWNQMSRVGQLLDPAADRLYILATLIGLTVRDVVPLWLTVALVGRDVLLAFTLPCCAGTATGRLPVHYLGKAATFNLLAGFPLLLLGEGDSLVSQVAACVRLGIRDLGDRTVLVGRSALPRPGDSRRGRRTERPSGRVPA